MRKDIYTLLGVLKEHDFNYYITGTVAMYFTAGFDFMDTKLGEPKGIDICFWDATDAQIEWLDEQERICGITHSDYDGEAWSFNVCGTKVNMIHIDSATKDKHKVLVEHLIPVVITTANGQNDSNPSQTTVFVQNFSESLKDKMKLSRIKDYVFLRRVINEITSYNDLLCQK